MSLARPLLALACAALLAVCAAQDPRLRAADRPGSRLANNWQCTTKYAGSLVGTMIQLPTVFIPAGQENAKIDIPNNCPPQTGLPLRGEVVQVCDDVAPLVTLVDFSPVVVQRLGQSTGVATVYVTQYCS